MRTNWATADKKPYEIVDVVTISKLMQIIEL